MPCFARWSEVGGGMIKEVLLGPPTCGAFIEKSEHTLQLF